MDKTSEYDPAGVLPERAHFTLREACEFKGLNYKTACNRPWLQPNGGKPDAVIGGRRVFRRSTLAGWLSLDDASLQATSLEGLQ